MSKKNSIMFQSPSIRPNKTIIWNKNIINGNISINNNYSSENLNAINPIKRSDSSQFKHTSNKSTVTPNYSNYFKQIKLGKVSNIKNNTNNLKNKIKEKKNYVNSSFNTKTEGNQEYEMTNANSNNYYLNYLYEHLDTSCNANNELNNKKEMLMNMKRDMESDIKRNNDIYKSLILSYNDKLKMNNKYKNEFINFLNLYKKQYTTFNNEINDKKNELNDLMLQNNSLKKEIESTEEIINYLKNTQDILSINNNLVEKYEEQNLDNELDILKKELIKLKEIKDSGDKFKNIKTNKKLEELKKEKTNTNINIDNNNKVRNKEFIKDRNRFRKISTDNNNKQRINKDKDNDIDDKNISKDSLKQKESIINENEKEKDNEDLVNIDEQELNSDKDIKEKDSITSEKKEIKKIEKEPEEINEEENNIEDKSIEELDIVIEPEIKKQKEPLKKEKKKKTKKKFKLIEENIDYNKNDNDDDEIIISKQKKAKKKKKPKEIYNNSEENEKEGEKEKETIEIKEYDLSDISDNLSKKSTKRNHKNKEENNESEEKKENINTPQLSPNLLSIEELSSIKSASKTQKKLSQSQESIMDILTTPLKGSYLYTITPKGKLLSYNITKKRFAIIDSAIIDGWTSFIPNYLKNIEGSLLLNTLEGLFIITGNNHTDLYFYSQEKCLIAKITTFKYGHKYGGLLLSPSPDNNLFVIGGECPNNEVEELSFEDDEIKEMPNLLTRRINASYTFINYKLYAIFGEENNTIEFLNIKKLKNKWNKIEYKMDKGNISNIYGHVSLPVQDNNILIVGGKNNPKMMVLDLDDKTLDITDMKIPFMDTVGEYMFDKEKFFNQTANEESKDKDGKNVKQLIGMDSYGNIHLFDYNFNYVVLLIKNHSNNNI